MWCVPLLSPMRLKYCRQKDSRSKSVLWRANILPRFYGGKRIDLKIWVESYKETEAVNQENIWRDPLSPMFSRGQNSTIFNREVERGGT